MEILSTWLWWLRHGIKTGQGNCVVGPSTFSRHHQIFMLCIVAPTAYTTFYAGALANAEALKTDVSVLHVQMHPTYIYHASYLFGLTLRFISLYRTV